MGLFGAPWRTAYCASKHAMNGFHEGLRAELHPYGIPVTVIMPGYVNTNVTINALKGDGSKHAVKAKTTAGGWEPDYFARRALSVIARKKREAILAGPREWLACTLKRFLPGVLHRVLNENLSERETEILTLVAEGRSSREIADQLHLSHHTINTHRKNILKKLACKSAAELMNYAYSKGLIEKH